MTLALQVHWPKSSHAPASSAEPAGLQLQSKEREREGGGEGGGGEEGRGGREGEGERERGRRERVKGREGEGREGGRGRKPWILHLYHTFKTHTSADVRVTEEQSLILVEACRAVLTLVANGVISAVHTDGSGLCTVVATV